MGETNQSRHFYQELPSFADFLEITRDEHFVLAPEDWIVVITDVKGSTKAIEAGRYKDVNTVGAASISVVQELLDEDFPYVFGGDGATLLIPPDKIESVLEVLMRLERLSREKFDLGLRIGRVSVREVVERGGRIEVAKHELTAKKCAAVFRGGGLGEAEKLIKGDEENYCVVSAQAGDLDLKGLSCRWKPLPNKRGLIVSLLVLSRREPPVKVYDQFLRHFKTVFEGVIDESNPVNTDRIGYKTIRQCLDDETRYITKKKTWAFFKRFCEIVAAVLIFRHGWPAGIFNAKKYRDSMRDHSDHRKFDDMLRMIVDCSHAQARNIHRYLEARRLQGDVFYGMHTSRTALMTCYVQYVKDGQHIHFIDGGDGGYAMAAKQFKDQLKEAAATGEV